MRAERRERLEHRNAAEARAREDRTRKDEGDEHDQHGVDQDQATLDAGARVLDDDVDLGVAVAGHDERAAEKGQRVMGVWKSRQPAEDLTVAKMLC